MEVYAKRSWRVYVRDGMRGESCGVEPSGVLGKFQKLCREGFPGKVTTRAKAGGLVMF